MTGARTHLEIDRRLSGEPIELSPGRARLASEARSEMAADDRGLVHGGFVFSLADHAAMLAVNEPNVVLSSAEFRFLAPVRVGEQMVATAEVVGTDGAKHEVEVTVEAGSVAPRPVASGTFRAVVTARHVLESTP